MICKKGSLVVEPSNKWSSSYLSAAETQRCMLDPTWNWNVASAGGIDIALAVTIDQDSLQDHDIKIDTKCYDLIEGNCIYCDELHWKY
jgi:hypothetical protein